MTEPDRSKTQLVPSAEWPALDGSHWTFSLEVYASPGVSEACILLQDEAAVDVNVLLVSLYTAKVKGYAIPVDLIETADKAIAEWRNEVVVPLRKMRRALKAAHHPAQTSDGRAFRGEIKKVELAAEQIEQAHLAQLLVGLSLESEQSADCCDITAKNVVDYYLAKSAVRCSADTIRKLASACAHVAAAAARQRMDQQVRV